MSIDNLNSALHYVKHFTHVYSFEPYKNSIGRYVINLYYAQGVKAEKDEVTRPSSSTSKWPMLFIMELCIFL